MNHSTNDLNDLRFKTLTAANWRQPDSTAFMFVRVDQIDGSHRAIRGSEWAERILEVTLSEHVPIEVRRLFSVAQGALLYGYFFYPLYTLGVEQLFRVAQSAVKQKCLDLGMSPAKAEKLGFMGQVKRLVDHGVVQPEAQQYWDALRKLRNLTSHPEDQTILPPSIATDELRRIAADIDGLFV